MSQGRFTLAFLFQLLRHTRNPSWKPDSKRKGHYCESLLSPLLAPLFLFSRRYHTNQLTYQEIRIFGTSSQGNKFPFLVGQLVKSAKFTPPGNTDYQVVAAVKYPGPLNPNTPSSIFAGCTELIVFVRSASHFGYRKSTKTTRNAHTTYKNQNLLAHGRQYLMCFMGLCSLV